MIFNHYGKRKYLTPKELKKFIDHASSLSADEATFCLFLAFTGCRISEALETNVDRLDEGAGAVVVRSLKKRSDEAVYRAVPVPTEVFHRLADYGRTCGPSARLWPWSRTKGWKVVKDVLSAIEVHGAHACPKGLRHAFGVAAIQSGVPLNVLQRWLGHARLETTAIYANAVGDEERLLAQRMWSSGELWKVGTEFPKRRRS